MLPVTVGFKTDMGLVRTLNQDRFVVQSAEALGGRAEGLFVVADGISSGKGGEIASQLAISTVDTAVREDILRLPSITPDTLADMVKASLHTANTAVWTQGRRVREQHGMGTTCIAALLYETTLIVGNVGDSRCYLLRNGTLLQLSRDHSLLQSRKGHRSASSEGRGQFSQVMTRALGFASTVSPDVDAYVLQDGDALLLCSDGLSNLLDNAGIAALLRAHASPQETSERLVAAANAQGGDDNITVIVVHYGNFVPEAPLPSDGEESEERPSAAIQTEAASSPWWKRIGRRRGSPRQP